VYSIGGGNKATVETFDALGRGCRVFVAHDLDDDNRALLRDGRISAVLYHDLAHDMRHACQIIMQAHHALPPGVVATGPSAIQVVTPHNIPLVPATPPPERHRA
jgi:LacI family transcriptional regulator